MSVIQIPALIYVPIWLEIIRVLAQKDLKAMGGNRAQVVVESAKQYGEL